MNFNFAFVINNKNIKVNFRQNKKVQKLIMQ